MYAFLKKEEKNSRVKLIKNNLSNYSFYRRVCYINLKFKNSKFLNLKIQLNKISFVYFSNSII